MNLPLHLDVEEDAEKDADKGRRELALRVTPTVTDAGETTRVAPVWVGTEAAIRTPRAPRQAP